MANLVPSDLPHTLVLVFGILWLAKSLWALLSPASFRRVAEAWMTTIHSSPGITGLLMLVLAAAVIASFMIYREIAHWILLAIGLLYLWAGSTLFRNAEDLYGIQTFLLKRSNTALRIIATIGMLCAILLIWVAITEP